MEIQGLGNMAAKTICDDWKIKTQGDKKLEEAKKLVYLKGFNEGVMVVGNHTGQKVDALRHPFTLGVLLHIYHCQSSMYKLDYPIAMHNSVCGSLFGVTQHVRCTQA